MDEFEKIAADLEKSIKIDETAAPLSVEAQELLKDPANVRKALLLGAKELAKAKGAMPTDLKQEKAVKDDEVTDTEADPAEHPVKSGKGYKDSRPYVGKMGKGEGCDDDDAGDDEDDKPNFFGKKKGKGKMDKGAKVKKSEADDGDDDLVDVTEHMESMEKAVNFLIGENAELKKSMSELTEGTGIFGQVLHQIAENDPRRDNLIVNMAKAIAFVVGEIKDLRKGVSLTSDMMKAVTELPGAPRAAGLSLLKSDIDGAAAAGVIGGGNSGKSLSEGDRQRLWQAAMAKSITKDEYRTALATGDAGVLQKAAKA